MPERVETMILGAGVAGLSAAWTLKEAGQAATVFEAAERPGGLLDNFEVQGFRFDNGVHLSFASEPEVRAIFDRTPYKTHQALSFCWEDGRWLKHPVQNNLFPLDAAEKAELIAGLAEQGERPIANYEDWLIGQYGAPIAERWPFRYTRKYWTIPAAELGVDWIGKRMRKAELKEVLFGAMTAETPSTYYISEMRYPERGGYRAFIEPLIAAADVRTGRRAVAIDLAARVVRFETGEEIGFDRLISTLPLPVLVELTRDVPDDLRADAATLYATRMDLISIGLRKADVAPSLWLYIYDEDILAARIYSPSAKSADNAPAGCGSLQFEIYSSVQAPQTHSVEEMRENCLKALETMGIATRADVIFAHHKHVPYANVVFDLGMEARRDRVKAWFIEQGIGLAGRFGEWDYLWSNQSFMSGRKAGLALVGQTAS